MISVTNLHKSYGDREILSAVDARFPADCLTSLIGPNGAGKSTLLMLMARLLQPSKGTVQLNGENVSGMRTADYAKRVATLSQSPDFSLRLRVSELVAFGRFPYSQGALTREDRRIVDEALEFLSLCELRNAYVDELSGGQRQMAFLAMTIAQRTECLLLDEPLNNLDMHHAVQLMRALRGLCDDLGRTVVTVIHDINFAANYSDHIVAMKAGSIHGAGAVEEVITEDRLRDLYSLDIEILKHGGGRLCNYFTRKGERQ